MSTSHETHRIPSAEIPDELKGLTLENIEQMRAKQEMEVRTATQGKSFLDDSGDYKTARDEAIAEFDDYHGKVLDAQGIDEDHPKREEYLNYLRSLSVDKIPSSEWHVGPMQADGTYAPSGRDRAKETFAGLVRSAKSPDTTPLTPDQYIPIDSLARQELDETRKHFAELVSKRTTKMFESKKKSNEIDATHEDLADFIRATATEMADILESKGFDEAAIGEAIDQFTNEQIDKTVEDVEAERASEYTKRSPLMKRFLNKWSSWGGNGKKFFSEDRFKGNAKKGLLTGGVLAAVAIPLAPAIGAIGAGAVLGAATLHIGRSMARRLANNKLDDTANSASIAERQAADMQNEIDLRREGSADAGLHDLLGVVKERSERYRKRNRNRLMGSLALAATIDVVAGAAVGNYLTDSGLTFGKAGEFISDKAGDLKHALGGKPDHQVIKAPEKPIPKVVIPKPTVIDHAPKLSYEASIIRENEGWMSELKQADPGITHAEMQDKLQKLLDTKDPDIKKWVYEYTNPDGSKEPRITHPGKIPASMVKSILKL
jgi:hypothetical protein